MATKSAVTALTNYDSGLRNDPQATKGRVVRQYFTYEKVAGNTDGDQIQLMRLRKDWMVASIQIQNDALTGLTDANVGLWSDKDPSLSAAVAENCYYDALSLASAAGLTEVAFQASGGRDKAKTNYKVWQDAGAASEEAAADFYRLVLNLITGGTATGTISGYVDLILPS